MQSSKTVSSGLDLKFQSLHNVYSDLFDRILYDAALDERLWQNRLKSLERLSLLEYFTPSPFVIPPLNVDEALLHDSRYRRFLIARLKAPRPSRWSRHKLNIDQGRILCDAAYRAEVADFLTKKWLSHMQLDKDSVSEVCSQMTFLTLAKTSCEEFTFCLDNLALNDLDPNKIASILVQRMAYQLIDSNPKFQTLITRMKSEFAQIRKEFNKQE